MVRAFVALELSGEIQKNLAGAQAALRGCSARLTFVEPALIHVTAKFLGEVDGERLAAVKEALAAIPFSPFPAEAGEIAVNSRRNPRTVWSVVHDGGNGARLAAAIDAALAPLGIPTETRPFTAHATVARVREADPSLFAALDRLKGRTYGSCRVDGLKLKKSTLTPRGPVYEDLLEVRW